MEEKKSPNQIFDKEKDSSEDKKTEEKTSMGREILDFLKVIIIALLITNLLNVFVFTLSQVRQSSMETTLIAGDELIVEKLSYSFRNPERGDIIVFISGELSINTSVWARFKRLYEDMFSKFTRKEVHKRLVKRVIGVPGDVIDIHDGMVYINGEQLEEPYVHQLTQEKAGDYPMTIPEGKYFAMGDNRGMSMDSRDFGFVKREQIEGRVLFRFWPLNKFGGVK